MVQLEPNPQPSPKPSDIPDLERKNAPDYKAVIVVVMAGIIALVASIFVIYFTQRREAREAARRDKQKEEFVQREQIKTKVKKGPLWESLQVKDSSMYLSSSNSKEGDREAFIQRYLSGIQAVDSKLAKENLMQLPKSYWPEVLVRKDNQVSMKTHGGDHYFNTNKLTDFVGNNIFIGQPPAYRADMELYWQLIWDEMIGCLVWIGDVHGVGDYRMWFEAYAAVDAASTQDAVWKLGPIEVTVIESFIQNSPTSFYTHRVKLVRTFQGKREEQRQISILHIDSWEQVELTASETYDSDPKPAFIEMMADALSYVHYKGFKKAKKGSVALPNLLVNCPTGTHQSITFVVSYISRQMWLYKKKRRFQAAIEHVRRHRYNAWGDLTRDELFLEIQIVARVTTIIEKRFLEQEHRRKCGEAGTDNTFSADS